MEIKFNCSNPKCQQRLSVEESMAGTALACPACATMLQVPLSTSIKFNCPSGNCGQPMVVDVSEAGRFVKCPACGKPSQVPGAPPKPIVPQAQAKTQADEACLPAPRKRSMPAAVVPFFRLLAGWGIGAALCGLVMLALHIRSRAALPPHFDAMLDETYFHGEIWGAPVENYAGTALLYVRTTESGAGIFLANLATLGRTQIALGQIAGRDRERAGSVKLFGWSPNDGYLAFSTITNGKENRHLVICDGGSGKEITSIEAPQSVDTGGWLTADSLALFINSRNSRTLYVLNMEDDSRLGQFGKKGLVLVQKFDRTASLLVPDSDRSVAYVESGNIWSLDIPTKRAVQLTHLANAAIDGLDYSAVSHKYLYSATTGGAGKKSLYQCDPRAVGAESAPLNCTNYAFKGQWLKDGEGIAYVGSKGQSDYLVIGTKDETARTNLFTFPEMDPTGGLLNHKVFPEGGQVVRNYSISPQGDKIYTVASLHYEPLSIWEYDLASRSLRQVVPVKEHPVFSEFIAPVEGAITNAAGKKIDYYYLPPSGLKPNRKYPVFMDQYSDLGFQPSSQFLANAGIFYVTASPYGRGIVAGGVQPADTVAVYQELLKNPNVDPRRIYVGGERHGSANIDVLLENWPELWRGAIILSPVEFQQVSGGMKMVPSIFISIGAKDDAALKRATEQYALTACTHGALAQILYGNEGHVFYGIDEIKQRYKAVATFILEDR